EGTQREQASSRGDQDCHGTDRRRHELGPPPDDPEHCSSARSSLETPAILRSRGTRPLTRFRFAPSHRSAWPQHASTPTRQARNKPALPCLRRATSAVVVTMSVRTHIWLLIRSGLAD